MSLSATCYIERRKKNRLVYTDEWECVLNQHAAAINIKSLLIDSPDSSPVIAYDSLTKVTSEDISTGTRRLVNVTDGTFNVCGYYILTLPELLVKINDIRTDVCSMTNTICNAMGVSLRVYDSFEINDYDDRSVPCIPISKHAMSSMIVKLLSLTNLGQLNMLYSIADEYSAELTSDAFVEHEVRLVIVVA